MGIGVSLGARGLATSGLRNEVPIVASGNRCFTEKVRKCHSVRFVLPFDTDSIRYRLGWNSGTP